MEEEPVWVEEQVRQFGTLDLEELFDGNAIQHESYRQGIANMDEGKYLVKSTQRAGNMKLIANAEEEQMAAVS
jgi:hypothetical protein